VLAFSAIKENLFPSSGDKAGNVPSSTDHIKKTFCRVAGHSDDGKIDFHIISNASDGAIFGAE
jgi:hypothetical protein